MPGHISPAPVLILYFNTTPPCVLFSVLKLGTSPISLHSQSCWFPFVALQGSYSSMMCKSSLFDPNQRCFISCGLVVPMINFTFYCISIPQGEAFSSPNVGKSRLSLTSLLSCPETDDGDDGQAGSPFPPHWAERWWKSSTPPLIKLLSHDAFVKQYDVAMEM